MKRKILLALIVLIGGLMVIDLPRLMSACPNYPPPGACGDPTTNPYAECYPHPNCTCGNYGCHGVTPLAASVATLTTWITDSATYIQTGNFSDTLNSSFKYVPGATYYIGFLLNASAVNGVYGFQMAAMNDTNMAGSFIVTDAAHNFLQTDVYGVQYISHHNADSTGFHNWVYKWIAPVASEPVTFYYTYNFSSTTWLDTVPCVGCATGLPGGSIYEGNTTIQSIPSGISDINDKISNLEIFPNPVSDQFNLSFTLKQSEPISLNVYSVDGKMVQQLMQDETRGEGYFNSSFDISNLAAGIYLAKLSVGDASITKKITKL